jgi:hypothetical protein
MMELSQDRADAIRLELHHLAAALRTAGLIDHGLALDGTTLATEGDLSEDAQAFILAYTPPTPDQTRDEVLYETLGEAKAALDAAQTPDEKLAAFSQGLAAIQSIFGAP